MGVTKLACLSVEECRAMGAKVRDRVSLSGSFQVASGRGPPGPSCLLEGRALPATRIWSDRLRPARRHICPHESQAQHRNRTCIR